MYFYGGSCGTGYDETDVFTSNGQNEQWAYSIVGADPPGGTDTAVQRADRAVERFSTKHHRH
jgi:hypothetical protein